MAAPDTSSTAIAPIAPKSRTPAPPLVTANDLLWLLYLYPVRLLARVVPRSLLYAIGRLADPFVQFHARRGKAKSAAWIAEACGASASQATRIARQSVSNKLFRFLDELILLHPSSGQRLHCDGLDGIEHLEAAVGRGEGVVLLVGHFCANRIAARYLAAKGHSLLFLRNARPNNRSQGLFGQRFLAPRSVRLTKRAYPDQVYFQDPDCSLKIMQRLRAGGLVLIQMDGSGGTRAVEHPFLGKPWRVPSGIFEIVRLTGCAVVPMLCLGRSDGFRICFDRVLEFERESSREAFLAANMRRFLASVEKQVVENPGEWTLWNLF
jgi:KDO2-lipid IV(A) lauroyltransferase